MGSFNTVCAITRTPIQEGGLARVFFLEMDAFEMNYRAREGRFGNIMVGSQCYPWDNFTVLGYPMVGKYDDYNRYTFGDTELADATLAAINSRYIVNRVAEGKTLDDYNSYHDYMEIEEIPSMHDLQDMEHSGSLFIKGRHGYKTAVVKMAIHEEVYQMMIEGEWSTGWGENRKTFTFESRAAELVENFSPKDDGGLSMLSERRQLRIQQVKEANDVLVEKGEITAEQAQETYDEVIELAVEMDMIAGDDRQEWLSQSRYREDMQGDCTPELRKSIADSIVGTELAVRWMQANNYELAPVVLGGQDYDTSVHAKRLRKLADVVSTMVPEFRDEECFTVNTEITERFTMSLSATREKVASWFDETDQELIDYYDAIKIADEQSFFTIGDESKLDKWGVEYSAFPSWEVGTVIHFVD